jgi:hypothetical protein
MQPSAAAFSTVDGWTPKVKKQQESEGGVWRSSSNAIKGWDATRAKAVQANAVIVGAAVVAQMQKGSLASEHSWFCRTTAPGFELPVVRIHFTELALRTPALECTPSHVTEQELPNAWS